MENLSQELLFMRSQQLEVEFSEGSFFTSIEEFSTLFSKSAINKGVRFYVKQQNKKNISFGCKSLTCKFKVNACIKLKINQCVVTKMQPYHCNNCSLIKINISKKSLIKDTL